MKCPRCTSQQARLASIDNGRFSVVEVECKNKLLQVISNPKLNYFFGKNGKPWYVFQFTTCFEAAAPVKLEEGCFDRIKAAMPAQQPAVAESNSQKKPEDSEAATADQDCGLGSNDFIFFAHEILFAI